MTDTTFIPDYLKPALERLAEPPERPILNRPA